MGTKLRTERAFITEKFADDIQVSWCKSFYKLISAFFSSLLHFLCGLEAVVFFYSGKEVLLV